MYGGVLCIFSGIGNASHSSSAVLCDLRIVYYTILLQDTVNLMNMKYACRNGRIVLFTF